MPGRSGVDREPGSRRRVMVESVIGRSFFIGVRFCVESSVGAARSLGASVLGDLGDGLAGLDGRELAGDVGLADDAHEAVASITGRRRTCWSCMTSSASRMSTSAPIVSGLPSARLPAVAVRRVAALGDALHHDVAVGEHALQPVVVAADRQGADVEVAHHARGFGERLVLLHALRVGRHQVACDGHRNRPLVSSRRSVRLDDRQATHDRRVPRGG